MLITSGISWVAFVLSNQSKLIWEKFNYHISPFPPYISGESITLPPVPYGYLFIADLSFIDINFTHLDTNITYNYHFTGPYYDNTAILNILPRDYSLSWEASARSYTLSLHALGMFNKIGDKYFFRERMMAVIAGALMVPTTVVSVVSLYFGQRGLREYLAIRKNEVN